MAPLPPGKPSAKVPKALNDRFDKIMCRQERRSRMRTKALPKVNARPKIANKLSEKDAAKMKAKAEGDKRHNNYFLAFSTHGELCCWCNFTRDGSVSICNM
jgi:hypothetical protein